MPFKSDKQRRFLWSQKPEVAKQIAYKQDGGPIGGNGMNVKKVTQKDRYGNSTTVEYESPEKPFDLNRYIEAQMENGPDLSIAMMSVPPVGGESFNAGNPVTHPGGPKGEDTVPAWLTPGEFVVNKEAMQIPGNAEMVEAINNQGRQVQQLNEGGSVWGDIKGLWDSIVGGAPEISGPAHWAEDDNLLDALAEVESGGDNNAVSPAGAVGMYQWLPSSAAQPGYGVEPFDPRDPVASRKATSQYLKGMQDHHGFTEEEALMAYNWGPGNVVKRRAAGQGPIPDETTSYVGKVRDGRARRQSPDIPMPIQRPQYRNEGGLTKKEAAFRLLQQRAMEGDPHAIKALEAQGMRKSGVIDLGIGDDAMDFAGPADLTNVQRRRLEHDTRGTDYGWGQYAADKSKDLLADPYAALDDPAIQIGGAFVPGVGEALDAREVVEGGREIAADPTDWGGYGRLALGAGALALPFVSAGALRGAGKLGAEFGDEAVELGAKYGDEAIDAIASTGRGTGNLVADAGKRVTDFVKDPRTYVGDGAYKTFRGAKEAVTNPVGWAKSKIWDAPVAGRVAHGKVDPSALQGIAKDAHNAYPWMHPEEALKRFRSELAAGQRPTAMHGRHLTSADYGKQGAAARAANIEAMKDAGTYEDYRKAAATRRAAAKAAKEVGDVVRREEKDKETDWFWNEGGAVPQYHNAGGFLDWVFNPKPKGWKDPDDVWLENDQWATIVDQNATMRGHDWDRINAEKQYHQQRIADEYNQKHFPDFNPKAIEDSINNYMNKGKEKPDYSGMSREERMWVEGGYGENRKPSGLDSLLFSKEFLQSKGYNEGGMIPQYRFNGDYITQQVQDAQAAGELDTQYGWNVLAGRPYTREEGIAAGTVAPPEMDVPVVEDTKPWWAGEKYGDPYATISGDMGRHFTEGDFGEGSQGWADDAAAAAVAETPEYQAHEARAKSTGALPTPPQAWMDEAMAGSLARSAPASDVEQIEAVSNAAAEAANEVIEAGGTQLEAEAAADIAAATAQPDAATKTKPITKDEATSNLNKLLNESSAPEDTGPGEDQPGDVANENAVKQAGEVTTPQEKKETEHWLKGVFGDLFSKEELAKTAILYLGSRALGYSHNGSIQWAAKEHLARDTAKTAAKAASQAKLQERAFELAKTGKFDPKAIKNYEATGDISYLQGGQQHTITGNTMTRSVDGNRVAFQEVKDAQGNVMYTDGKNYYPAAYIENNTREYEPSFQKGTPEYRARRSRATGDAAGRFKEVFDNQDTYRVGSGHDTQIKHHTNIRPKQAADEFWAFAEKNNLDPESDQALVIMTNAYNAAIQEGKNSEGKVKPNRLTKYLEQEMIREKTGAPDLFVTNTKAVSEGKAQPQYISSKKMQDLDVSVDSLIAISPNKATINPDMVYREMVAAWNGGDPTVPMTQKDRDRYNNSAASGESGFYLFMKDQIGELYKQTQTQ